MTRIAVCADVGSTFTKVAAVDLDTGTVVASADRRTTVDTDVLRGLTDAISAATGAASTGSLASIESVGTVESVDVCSSAGGGLRLAVVGYETLVTAEAGHRVGLSAGARVVRVSAGRLDRAGVTDLRAARPDVVLLVGGTDGGDVEVLLHNAKRLAATRLRVPVVVAGNAAGRDEAMAVLAAASVPAVAADNVLPRIGDINPSPARAAIRDVFLSHVIGGKRLSKGPRFASLVRGPTPDLVLTAAELLADEIGGDLLVVDVGGATTDVYSVVRDDDQREVAGTLWHSRTVEGDLGMRWSAPGVVEAAVAERLLTVADQAWLERAAQLRADDPAFLPATDDDERADLRIAQLAAVIAVRRHARGELSGTAADRVRRGRRDLRHVRLLVGSGGVLRHASASAAQAVLAGVLADHAGGWSVPVAATAVVDTGYLLAPAGLLASRHPQTARALLRNVIRTPSVTAAAAIGDPGSESDLARNTPERHAATPRIASARI